MKLRFLTALCFCVIPTSVLAADSYLCEPYMSTGFSISKVTKSWNRTDFKTENTYVVKKVGKQDLLGAEDYKWQIMILGESTPFVKSTNDVDEHGRLIFDHSFKHFNMNTKNMKFLYSYTHGYWPEGTGEDDTPFMEIGKCTPQ